MKKNKHTAILATLSEAQAIVVKAAGGPAMTALKTALKQRAKKDAAELDKKNMAEREKKISVSTKSHEGKQALKILSDVHATLMKLNPGWTHKDGYAGSRKALSTLTSFLFVVKQSPPKGKRLFIATDILARAKKLAKYVAAEEWELADTIQGPRGRGFPVDAR